MSKLKSNKLVIPLFLTGVFLVVLYVSYCFPLTGDDITLTSVKSDTVSDWLNYALNFGNGRYLGNMTVLPMVQNQILRVIVKSVFMLLGIVLLKKIGKAEGLYGYVMASLIMLAMPISIFRQAFVWTAGFQNYFPPIILLMLSLVIIRKISQQKGAGAFLLLLVIMVLSFSSQLFVEHNTVFNFLIGMALIIYSIKEKNKKTVVSSFVYTIASLAGLILTFSHKKTDFVDSYRKISFKGIFENYEIIADTLRQGVVVWVIFSVMCLIAINKNLKSCKNQKIIKVVPLIKGILYFFPLWCAFELLLNEQMMSLEIIRYTFSLVLPIAYLGTVMIAVCCFVGDKKVKANVIIGIVSSVVSAAPLLIVFPIEARCMLLSYVCLGFSALNFLNYNKNEIKPITAKIAGTALAAVLICQIFIYSDIAYVSRARENYIIQEKGKGAQTIIIPKYPHENFIHFDADAFNFKDYHHYYYEEPGDLEFYVTDWDKWLKIIEQQEDEK